LYDYRRFILSGIGKGLIDGVKNIGGAIKEAAGGLVDGFKSFFGIASPSKLFRDVIGANLAAGIGEGFVEEMDSISGDMNKAVPTSLPAPELEMMGVSGGRNAATASSALQSILHIFTTFMRLQHGIHETGCHVLPPVQQHDHPALH